MGVDAGAKALAAAGVQPADVDLVIAVSCTAQSQIPGIGPRIASGLGMPQVGAFDLNAGCAGFCYGLSAAADAVRSGNAQRVLVVASERLTDWIDDDDRGMAIIFGDGAGAALVGEPPTARRVRHRPGGLGKRRRGREFDRAPRTPGRPLVPGDGGLGGVPLGDDPAHSRCAARLRSCRRPAGEADAIVLHQANLRITESIARSLGAPQAILARDIVESGNTSGASVPLALSRLIDEGQVGSGDTLLLFAFGAGLTYAGQVVRLP